MPFVNGSALFNGDGTLPSSATSPGGPGAFNAVPSNTLTGGQTWLFDRAGVLDMAGNTLLCGNNVIIGAYGSGGLAQIIGAGSELFSCSTANSPITIEDIYFRRNAAVGGIGLRFSQMSAGGAQFTARNVVVDGFATCMNGDRSRNVTLDSVKFRGPSNAFAISATATGGNDCDDWLLARCEFDTGGGLLLSTSTSTATAGAWNRLHLIGNKFNNSTANDINLGMPTSQTNAALWLRVTAPSTVEMFTDQAATIPSNFPAWAPGATVFFAGFSNRANFGAFTVSSVVTNTLVVTETSLLTEPTGRNKGVHLRDATRAFNDPLIEGNVITSSGATPMNLNGTRGGMVRGNRVRGGRGVGAVSASIECINTLGLMVEENDIREMFVSSAVQTVDGMGIMFDGAAQNCVGRSNYISDLTPTTTATPNSGAGIALFESLNCRFDGNVVERAHRGAWVGGPGTVGSVRMMTASDCARGFEINSSPAAAAIALRNSIVVGCDETGVNNSSATIDSVTYFNNASGSALGTNALTTDPRLASDLVPLPGSPSLKNGADLGYVRGMGLIQGRKFRGAHVAARLRNAIGSP
jgi:Right handed beta helix region